MADMHTIEAGDVNNFRRLPAAEASALCKVLMADFEKAALVEPLEAVVDAESKLSRADELEAQVKRALAKAPRLDLPWRDAVHNASELRKICVKVGKLKKKTPVTGAAAEVVAFLAGNPVEGDVFEVAEALDGLVQHLRTEANALRSNEITAEFVEDVEAAEAALDAALENVVPGGLREVVLLRRSAHEDLAAAVWGAFGLTRKSPDRRNQALARFVQTKKDRSSRVKAARSAAKAARRAQAVGEA